MSEALNQDRFAWVGRGLRIARERLYQLLYTKTVFSQKQICVRSCIGWVVLYVVQIASVAFDCFRSSAEENICAILRSVRENILLHA